MLRFLFLIPTMLLKLLRNICVLFFFVFLSFPFLASFVYHFFSLRPVLVSSATPCVISVSVTHSSYAQPQQQKRRRNVHSPPTFTFNNNCDALLLPFIMSAPAYIFIFYFFLSFSTFDKSYLLTIHSLSTWCRTSRVSTSFLYNNFMICLCCTTRCH